MLCTQILLGVCLCANKDKLSLCSDAVVWSWGSSRREAILLLLPTYNGHGCLVVTRLYNIPPTIGPELREYSLFSKIMPPAAATVGSQGTMVDYLATTVAASNHSQSECCPHPRNISLYTRMIIVVIVRRSRDGHVGSQVRS